MMAIPPHTRGSAVYLKETPASLISPISPHTRGSALAIIRGGIQPGTSPRTRGNQSPGLGYPHHEPDAYPPSTRGNQPVPQKFQTRRKRYPPE